MIKQRINLMEAVTDSSSTIVHRKIAAVMSVSIAEGYNTDMMVKLEELLMSQTGHPCIDFFLANQTS